MSDEEKSAAQAAEAEMRFDLPTSVQANIPHFTGRTWLLPHLLAWLDRPAERTLLLTGAPGTGKSTVAAWLAGAGPLPAAAEERTGLERVRSLVRAAHYCRANALDTTDPTAFARRVGEQLARTVPGYGDALVATLGDLMQVSVEQHVERVEPGGRVVGIQFARLDLGALSEELSFSRVLVEPLQTLYQTGYDSTLILLLDALDEALTYHGRTDLVQLLARLDDLPPQVRVLATSRPDPRVFKFLPGARRVDLIDDAPPGEDDVRRYAYGRLGNLEEGQRRSLAARIARAADGIFLYAHLVLADLLPRLPEIPDLDTMPLPRGLSGVYHGFLNRELGADEERWYGQYEPLLGLVSVAQGEGLSRARLEGIAGQDLRWALRACKQCLQGTLPEGPFLPYHRSLAEYLLEDETNVDYHIDAASMHARIVDYYQGGAITWAEVDWEQVDSYGLRHLYTHLLAAGQPDLLANGRADPFAGIARLFTASYFRHKRAASGSDMPFLNEVTDVIRHHAGPQEVVDLCRQVLYEVQPNSYRALRTLESFAARAREDAALREGLKGSGSHMAQVVSLLAEPGPGAVGRFGVVDRLGAIYRAGTRLDRAVVCLAYGLCGDPSVQDTLLAEIDGAATATHPDYARAWYAAEGLHALGRERCREDTVLALRNRLDAKSSFLKTLALYILSRWEVRDETVAAAIRDGLRQRRSPRLCATAANATYLVPGLIPRQEAIQALRAVLERHTDEAGRPVVYRDREARNWNYARKRAAAALREIAPPDPELIASLRANLEQVQSWRGRARDEEDRRGLEETLEEALEQIQARKPKDTSAKR